MRTLLWIGGAVGFLIVAVIFIYTLSKLNMKEKSWQSMFLKIIGYTMCTIAALGTTLFSFMFFLFALKDTPLHNGEELPSFPLLSVSLVGALLIGAGVITMLRWVYKRYSA